MVGISLIHLLHGDSALGVLDLDLLYRLLRLLETLGQSRHCSFIHSTNIH